MEDIQYVKNRTSHICAEFGDGETLFNTKDITRLINEIDVLKDQLKLKDLYLDAEVSIKNCETVFKDKARKELIEMTKDRDLAVQCWNDEKAYLNEVLDRANTMAYSAVECLKYNIPAFLITTGRTDLLEAVNDYQKFTKQI